MMGLDSELKEITQKLLDKYHQRPPISVVSASELFKRFVTRQSMEIQDFEACKQKLIERGEFFAKVAEKSKDKIIELFKDFIRDRMSIMISGYSPVIIAIISAVSKKRKINVIILESRPFCDGHKTFSDLKVIQKSQQPSNIDRLELILDSAAACHMSHIDFVLTGAEGVVENGGIINKIGTYQLAIVAKALQRPFYVAVESFKFTRSYPLGQQDIPQEYVKLNGKNIMDPVRKMTMTDSMENLSSFSSNWSSSSSSSEEPKSSNIIENTKSHFQNDNAVGFGEQVDNAKSSSSSMEFKIAMNDYTPPKLITLLFTDLGILTTSAVSDELIRLYA